MSAIEIILMIPLLITIFTPAIHIHLPPNHYQRQQVEVKWSKSKMIKSRD
jgi:hypothetical protein